MLTILGLTIVLLYTKLSDGSGFFKITTVIWPKVLSFKNIVWPVKITTVWPKILFFKNMVSSHDYHCLVKSLVSQKYGIQSKLPLSGQKSCPSKIWYDQSKLPLSGQKSCPSKIWYPVKITTVWSKVLSLKNMVSSQNNHCLAKSLVSQKYGMTSQNYF